MPQLDHVPDLGVASGIATLDANGVLTASQQGPGSGLLSSTWSFSTTITDADPGSGNFRFNNATQASATFIYVSDFSDNGVDVSTILLALANNDRIYIQRDRDSSIFQLVRVTGTPTDAAGYVKIPIVVEDSGTDLGNNNKCVWIVSFTHGAIGGGGQTDTVVGSSGITNVGNNTNADMAPTYGTGANTICQGNDARLSDARTPTSHASSHQNGGGDEVNVGGLSGQLADNQNPVPATESLVGGLEIATQAETDAGTADDKIVTPLKMVTHPSWGGGSSKVFDVFTPGGHGLYPSSSPQRLTRNGHPVWAFDDTVDETIILLGVIGAGYAGGTINVKIQWAANGVTTGNAKWNAQWERMNTALDLDADSFAAIQTTTTTTAGTNGQTVITTIAFTQAQADGLTAEDAYRLRVIAHATNAGHTIAADAQVVRVWVEEA